MTHPVVIYWKGCTFLLMSATLITFTANEIAIVLENKYLAMSVFDGLFEKNLTKLELVNIALHGH